MFKNKLKELREKNNISQYQLAEKIFVSRSAIAKWENGLGMPSSDSIDMLCNFFNVSKDELLCDDDPTIVINNVEKKSKKLITILLVILSIFLVYNCANAIATLIQIKAEEEYKIYRNTFYSEKYLAEANLEGLEMINGYNQEMYGKDGIFKAKLYSQESFDYYANYVYETLKYSTSISYLSSGYTLNDYDETSYSNYKDHYLMISENIFDHVDRISDHHPTMYSFYYITELDKDRNEKDSVDVNYVSLEYEKEINQFEMEIKRINSKEENHFNSKVYLANEYFDIKKIRINASNFYDYFTVASSINSIQFKLKEEYAVKDYTSDNKNLPFFKIFSNVNFNIENVDENDVKTEYTVTKTFINMANEYMSFSCYDCDLNYFCDMQWDYKYRLLDGSVLYLLTKLKD